MTGRKPLLSQLQHRDAAVREEARRMLLDAVARHGGDLRATAEELRVSVRTVRKYLAPPVPDGADEGLVQLSEMAATVAPPIESVAPAPESPPAPDAPSAPASREEQQPATPATGGRSPFDDFAPRHRLPLGEHRRQPEGRAAERTEALTRATKALDEDDVGAGRETPLEPSSGASAAASPDGLRARRGGEWPHHQPGSAAGAIAAEGGGGPRRLAFVLHAHLPWVLGHGTWPHGEDWLAEAVVHCYLPLLVALRRLAAAGHRDLLTLSVSPVLAAQLADQRTPPLVRGYLAHRLAAARDLERTHPLGGWWQERYEGLAATYEALGGALLPAFAELARAGAIELSTCAVTHGYLPLLHRREHVSLQVHAATANHARWFGAAPAGLWMPECAYRPDGPWRHPITGAEERDRPGNERFLAGAGVRWTVVDAHALLGGEPLLPYPGFDTAAGWSAAGETAAASGAGVAAGAAATALAAAARLRPCRIGTSAVTALPREPHTARQVWSRHGGYPGDPRYLDFHKRQAESGLRLWRVTDPAGDLGDKLPYQPDEARAAVHDHAAHFHALVAALPGAGDDLVVCPYDAELFGHWWLEGVDWLAEVLARCDRGPVTATTPARQLVADPAAARARLQEGSWGEAGDHRMWVNAATAWMWEDLREAEEAVDAALPRLAPDRARAALAQLLLLAASDWPFLVTSGTAGDYAGERFALHRDRLRELLAAPAHAALPEWAALDLAGVELDPAWWEEPSS